MWCHYLSQIKKEDIQMKITRKFLIVAVIVLALAVMATPIIAAPPDVIELKWSTFQVDFNIPGMCKVKTTEYSTMHKLFGRPMASTDVGTAMVTEGMCVVGPFEIPTGDSVPFAVVDVRNPGNGTVIATYGIALIGFPTPIQAGANAWLTTGGPSLTYEGYAYVYTGGEPDYQVVQFTAEGHPPNFDVQPGPWK
jgi:hypothetical protein